MTYELSGFSQVRREGIVVNLGFTASVNVQLQLATLQETVTVTGASPVVDVTSTTSTFNVTQDMLQSLPNARDIWSVMGQSPGIRVSSIDVGGSRAGTQTGFEAFGFSGQVRVQVDGVNTTEGTGAAGFYYDYGSFDEIQLGGDGMDAQSATPGVQLNAVIKSGGNQLRGTFYSDYENQNWQGTNVDDRAAGPRHRPGLRTLKYYDLNGDIGGPIKRTSCGSTARSAARTTRSPSPASPWRIPAAFGQVTSLQNATYKLSYQLSQNNRLSHYVQYGRKLMPERGGTSTRYRYTVYNQDSGSWAGNLEWNSIVSPKFIFRAAISSFGYNWPNLPYGVNGELNDNLNHRRTDDGSGTTFTMDLNPPIATTAAERSTTSATRFQDDWLGGNHSIKFGMVSERESQDFRDEGFLDEVTLAFRSDSPTPELHHAVSRDATQHAAPDDERELAPRRLCQRLHPDQARVTAQSRRAVGLLQLVLPGSVDPREPVPRLLLRRRAGPDLRRPVLAAAHAVRRQQLHRRGPVRHPALSRR